MLHLYNQDICFAMEEAIFHGKFVSYIDNFLTVKDVSVVDSESFMLEGKVKILTSFAKGKMHFNSYKIVWVKAVEE